jgi:hypothetical protein
VSARDRSVVSAVGKRRRRQARVYVWRLGGGFKADRRPATLVAVGCGGGGRVLVADRRRAVWVRV